MCLGMAWLEQLLVWLVVICVVVALLKLLVGFVLPKLGLAGEVVAFVVAAVRIIIWGMICIFAIVVIFELISCLLGSGLGMPRIR
jgi:hypothetical protein